MCLSEYAIPNFHFHLTTAYGTLRDLGVPVGAFDYLGGIFHKVYGGWFTKMRCVVCLSSEHVTCS
jgi:hypothetical protein